jgi:hypothetical protein
VWPCYEIGLKISFMSGGQPGSETSYQMSGPKSCHIDSVRRPKFTQHGKWDWNYEELRSYVIFFLAQEGLDLIRFTYFGPGRHRFRPENFGL